MFVGLQKRGPRQVLDTGLCGDLNGCRSASEFLFLRGVPPAPAETLAAPAGETFLSRLARSFITEVAPRPPSVGRSSNHPSGSNLRSFGPNMSMLGVRWVHFFDVAGDGMKTGPSLRSLMDVLLRLVYGYSRPPSGWGLPIKGSYTPVWWCLNKKQGFRVLSMGERSWSLCLFPN